MPEPNDKQYPCPCCGYMSFNEPPGSYDICEICFWEDDPVQLRFPFTGGANIPLVQAQANFAAYGVSANRLKPHVRPVMEGDIRDPKWRPYDPAQDSAKTEVLEGLDYFDAACKTEGSEELYYWRKV